MISGTTRLYAIIGDPITHVRVPMVFNDYFARHSIDAACFAIEVKEGRLDDAWGGFAAMANLDGFIVTMPHKGEAKRLSDRLAGDAAHVGVVNTVRREQDGSFTGTLLDGCGFVAGLRAKGHDPAGKRIFIAGAGGAGQALAFALAAIGASALTIHNRNPAKAADLVARLAAAYPRLTVAQGDEDASGHDIAVNATALGMRAEDELPFSLASVAPATLVAEVVMAHEMTPLLTAASAKGCEVQPGRHMLDGQLQMMMEFFGLARGTR
ncbi:shikimate dehydrogenase [Rhizobiales bacterium GAS188]|nr:shikimate dehydrogenase [Rhizobiales bacterium GAS188]